MVKKSPSPKPKPELMTYLKPMAYKAAKPARKASPGSKGRGKKKD